MQNAVLFYVTYCFMAEMVLAVKLHNMRKTINKGLNIIKYSKTSERNNSSRISGRYNDS